MTPRRLGTLAAWTALAVLLVLGARAVPARTEEPPPGEPYLVLGQTQLFDGPDGLPAFCAEHGDEPRSRLRKYTVAALKKIAAREQPALLEALGRPKDARSLWIVNAVLVRLTDEQLAKVRALEVVKYVYPAGRVPAEGDPGKVAHVIPKRRRRKAFSPRGKTIPWNLEALRVPEAWKAFGVSGQGVVVAMFDSGVTYRHEDLERNIWINPDEKPNNGRDDDRNGYVDDLYGYNLNTMKADVVDVHGRRHGTLTSSLVAGDGTGGTVTGVAPRARLMSLIAFGGPWLAARAFQYALEEGADIVSMSFSIPGLGHTRGLWRRMAEHATAAGLVLVSGAGNFGRKAQVPVQIRIPEGIPCVVCAGGVSRDLQVPPAMSLGPVEWGSVDGYGDHPMPEGLIKPDICAFPGPGIGLIAPASSGYLPEDNGRFGNSLSAPQVAGVIALVLEKAPETTPWRVKALLEATAKDLEPEGKDVRTGAGLLDAFRAVEEAGRAITASD